VLLRYRLAKHCNKINIISTVDIPFFTKSDDVFYIDGDILFYKKPQRLNAWLTDEKMRKNILYLKDFCCAYALSERMCEKVYHVKYMNKFNMGVLCYPKKLFNLNAINEYFSLLESLDKDEVMLRDQTYFMIYFQRKMPMEMLNANQYHVYNTYQDKRLYVNNRNVILRHYTTNIRDEIYKDAIFLLLAMRNLTKA
jgi:lipopolysaccharide biosynthesis glycosyltransferase